MGRRKELTTVYLEPEQKEALRQLSESTRVPASVYIREAVEDLLKKYAKERRPSPEPPPAVSGAA